MYIPIHRVCSGLIAVVFISLLWVTANAEEGHNHATITNFQEGKHYYRISPAAPTNVEAGKVEVLELFWYGCPHCFEFEKYITSWKETMPDYITFSRMPAVMNRGWIPHARAYYSLETMGVLERIHPIFFEAIHVQGRNLRDKESMMRFLLQHDVDAEKFKNAYDSLEIETKVNRSDQLARQYGVSAVPTVVINGKYRATAGDAGGYENLLQLVNFLAIQEVGTAETISATVSEEKAK